MIFLLGSGPDPGPRLTRLSKVAIYLGLASVKLIIGVVAHCRRAAKGCYFVFPWLKKQNMTQNVVYFFGFLIFSINII